MKHKQYNFTYKFANHDKFAGGIGNTLKYVGTNLIPSIFKGTAKAVAGGAKATGNWIKKSPWQAAGVAAGVPLAAGALLKTDNVDNDDRSGLAYYWNNLKTNFGNNFAGTRRRIADDWKANFGEDEMPVHPRNKYPRPTMEQDKAVAAAATAWRTEQDPAKKLEAKKIYDSKFNQFKDYYTAEYNR